MCWRREWDCGSDVNCSRCCELTSLTTHLHLRCAYLKTKGGGEICARCKKYNVEMSQTVYGQIEAGEGHEMSKSVLKTGQSLSGKKKQILIQIYLLTLELFFFDFPCYVFFFFRFSHF